MSDISRTVNTAGDSLKTVIYIAGGGAALFVFWKFYKGVNFFEDLTKKSFNWAKKAGKDTTKWIGKQGKNLTHDLGKNAKKGWNTVTKPFHKKKKHSTKPAGNQGGKPVPKWIQDKADEKNRKKAANLP